MKSIKVNTGSVKISRTLDINDFKNGELARDATPAANKGRILMIITGPQWTLIPQGVLSLPANPPCPICMAVGGGERERERLNVRLISSSPILTALPDPARTFSRLYSADDNDPSLTLALFSSSNQHAPRCRPITPVPKPNGDCNTGKECRSRQEVFSDASWQET